jgi:hypothetical protein
LQPKISRYLFGLWDHIVTKINPDNDYFPLKHILSAGFSYSDSERLTYWELNVTWPHNMVGPCLTSGHTKQSLNCVHAGCPPLWLFFFLAGLASAHATCSHSKSPQTWSLVNQLEGTRWNSLGIVPGYWI